MKKALFLSFLLLCTLNLRAEVRLQRQGSAMQLVVNGQPMLVLGGELSNSAATSITDIDSVLPRMRHLGCNTVFVPIYWDLMEPKEGHFDFSLVDENIKIARANQLKLIFLWFGAWKNSMSCYAPLWFKKDTRRFPRSRTVNGKPLEIASAFSEQVRMADQEAFCQLMKHIADRDRNESTVIMIQLENEIGMLESARDHSSLAEKTFHTDAWRKTTGDEGQPPSIAQDERFQSLYHAQYVEQLAKAGKKILNLPMYVNAALNSRGRKPGEYPSAGPLAHLLSIWKKVAPDIDIFAPDIYDEGFENWVKSYKRPDNPFFTPETRLGEYSGVRALYVFGETDAIGFSVFAPDQAPEMLTRNLSKSYALLQQLSPLLLKTQGKGLSWGVLLSQKNPECILNDGENLLTVKHYYTLPWDTRATDGSPWPEGGGLILKLGPDEYLIAGSGMVVTFQTDSEKEQENAILRGEDGFVKRGQGEQDSHRQQKRFYGKRLGIGYVDQVQITPQGHLQYIRRNNGDQDHQGRHARISCDDYQILHVKLYSYE